MAVADPPTPQTGKRDDRQGRMELITGPSRSGKSRWAEHRAGNSGLRVHYLATGPDRPDDQSWQERLRRHQERRPASWTCTEVGLDLDATLDRFNAGDLVLIDSLGTWVSRALEDGELAWQERCSMLLAGLRRCQARVLLVSEQVGWGVVPSTAIGGQFRDRLGSLEESIVPFCSHLWLVVAGRAIDILPWSESVPRF